MSHEADEQIVRIVRPAGEMVFIPFLPHPAPDPVVGHDLDRAAQSYAVAKAE